MLVAKIMFAATKDSRQSSDVVPRAGIHSQHILTANYGLELFVGLQGTIRSQFVKGKSVAVTWTQPFVLKENPTTKGTMDSVHLDHLSKPFAVTCDWNRAYFLLLGNVVHFSALKNSDLIYIF